MWYLNVQLRKIMIPYSNMIGWVCTVLFVIGISSKVWLNHKCHCFLYKIRNENLPFIVRRTGNYLIFDQQWSTSLNIWRNYATQTIWPLKWSLLLVQFKTYMTIEIMKFWTERHTNQQAYRPSKNHCIPRNLHILGSRNSN